MPSDERSLTFREYPPLLLDLITARELFAERYNDLQQAGAPEGIEECKRDLDEVETALRECITALVKKADGFAAYIRSEQADAAAAKAESDRCYDLAKRRQARVDRMKAIGVEVLQSLGVKFIKGETSELRRWGNGGAHPVDIRQPELLPAKYQRFTLTLSGEEMADLSRVHPWMSRAAKPIEPDTDLIRKDLLKRETCPACGANGDVECPACNGEGSRAGSVPGAVLVDRQEHLRIS